MPWAIRTAIGLRQGERRGSARCGRAPVVSRNEEQKHSLFQSDGFLDLACRITLRPIERLVASMLSYRGVDGG